MSESQRKNSSGDKRAGERGAALVEAVVGLVMFALVALAAGQLLRVHVNPILMTERQRKAVDQAEAMTNELAARSGDTLADGGSFQVDAATGSPLRNADNTVTLNCSAAFCDQIIAVPQSTGTQLSLVRANWGTAMPAGGQRVYVRAWAIRTVDAARGLRGITTAVFPDGDEEPLSVQTVNVVLR